jgi:hypothetical protein
MVKEKEIAPHILVFDKSNPTDGTFSRADFVFDPQANRYTCPVGKTLLHSSQLRDTACSNDARECLAISHLMPRMG